MDEGARDETRWLDAAELEVWRGLMSVALRLPIALGAQLRRDAGLSFVEYYVLAGLSDAPGHTVRMSELAILANAELSRLSHMVARMESRGLVRREPDPTDRRYTNAILTDAGLAILRDAAPGHVEMVRSIVFDALEGEDLAPLGQAVARIGLGLDAAGVSSAMQRVGRTDA